MHPQHIVFVKSFKIVLNRIHSSLKSDLNRMHILECGNNVGTIQKL